MYVNLVCKWYVSECVHVFVVSAIYSTARESGRSSTGSYREGIPPTVLQLTRWHSRGNQVKTGMGCQV